MDWSHLPQLLEVGSVAKRCGVTPSGVHDWIRAGKLRPDARTEGGIYLFTVETVELMERARTARREARGRLPDRRA